MDARPEPKLGPRYLPQMSQPGVAKDSKTETEFGFPQCRIVGVKQQARCHDNHWASERSRW